MYLFKELLNLSKCSQLQLNLFAFFFLWAGVFGVTISSNQGAKNIQQVNHVTLTSCPQLFKRRNVCVPSSDESMLECPIQDPDISSTVPAAGVSDCFLLCYVFKCTILPGIYR